MVAKIQILVTSCLYLYHSYRFTTFVPPWAIVFPLLQQLHLTHLVFEFVIYSAGWDRWTAHNPADVVEEFRKLMIASGSRAEEGYRDYLEKWDESFTHDVYKAP
ncbi:hypothetical protein B0H14DRAFT_3156467 [Mycena olivaceomarginata]|nr:hypothetical protein B0H14DRAFT_3156467 [Mycena olivaceomarginata]